VGLIPWLISIRSSSSFNFGRVDNFQEDCSLHYSVSCNPEFPI
jgi:hypothetical protein